MNGPCRYFSHDLSGLQLDAEALQLYMADEMPDLCRCMKATNIPIDFMIPKWLLCLFFNTFQPCVRRAGGDSTEG